MLDRAVAEAVLVEAIAACDPARRVAAALASPILTRTVVGLAIGKAALAMARGAGPVARGLVVTLADDGQPLPQGWRIVIAAHPMPDERSLAAARAVIAYVESATADEVVLALISGGASALVEWPRVPLQLYCRIVGAVAAAGAPIAELNAVRGALSTIKSGGLALRSKAPIVTLAASDVIGDSLAVIGSGLTIGPWLGSADAVDLGAALDAQRIRALAIARRCGLPEDELTALGTPIPSQLVTRHDRAEVVAPMASFALAAAASLAARGLALLQQPEPIRGDVADLASQLALAPASIAWGEPTVVLGGVPGEGGRAQHLALALAKHLRGGPRAALVAGSDGIDGPPPKDRPAPAGAFVDGTTWDAIAAAGIDPDGALARYDAGTALAAAGALVVTGPTGINNADLVIID